MKIAIIGTGIAGNGAAYALATGSRHAITVYEKAPRPGGHTATVDIDYDGTKLAVDTGFIVYNEPNYPNLTALFRELGVATQPSDMGLSVSLDGGRREWAARDYRILTGFLASRRNAVSPRFWAMIKEIMRFNREAPLDRAQGVMQGRTLRQYLAWKRYGDGVIEDYLKPMGAAIWSMPPCRVLDFPAESFIAFFENHHLLTWSKPIWRTVTGGARNYVEAMTLRYRDRLRLGCGAACVERGPDGVFVTGTDGHTELFDEAIIASHTDETLSMLGDASDAERKILSAIAYAPNRVFLHRDARLMPRRKAAWAAWNVLDWGGREDDIAVTYWMNALQGIDPGKPLFISLNPPFEPAASLTFARFSYSHPQYDSKALAMQPRLGEIQGRSRLWFCGAWTGYGFHEDGLVSGLEIAERLDARLTWRESWRASAMQVAAE
ncbi:Predicted NAD/FAD-binding protein [Rhizobiales bacterium GAS188]|nr:Predicted NAD/FAD-binding protein [Rhizobiales bacterium GAS188]